ncbi:type II toxin-antitoxin system Phd/YefM family antitoxin [Candidatus Viridilinea mediisalina]|uniref:Antitoxin n=1 Tax=Candidatus Viridilinea mediisalina TaxID=2024553 RepID=A0A2A6RI41_9CHLR|nr:type II toxin-antitoxin system Phd/YefM family antitoxin [Candidatus Viridilinea mediisalina]PDW02747.1 type II toxin-antitoxin system prevent-host-death family antitoxin [Candidatus Viridilinea mediisalina]
MTHTWQLQEAKSKFSEVVEQAMTHGPQLITRRGVEVVIVVSYREYRALTLMQTKLSQFFRESPLAEQELDLERDPSPVRGEFLL